MASQLPAFPRFIFTVVEPISLLAGSVPAIIWPDWFISEQLPSSVIPTVATTAGSQVVAQQLGNCYGLLFLLGVAVLYSTTELKVVRNYLVALWIADIGHVVITYLALGHGHSAAVGEWNAMTWGNVGATVFLFLTRTAYFLGLFGPVGKSLASVEKKAQ
ncbi:hypothetical protein B0T17DRAFT_487494 [Bombardia bombarda]|uniref:DUF7704 domain-containing protein n=1 Tax=Bombardia bombarda TaxID=252184 RepID=A0AA40C8Z9_9PEZI|nr:hypothetical protein B0T17DRAFT_487494 [Bombardia bombarda]